MKNFTPVMLILSFLINIALGVLLYLGSNNPPPQVEENLAEIRAAGTYGPEGLRIVEGDATISAPGVVLQNTLVTGNLVLTEEIGDGSLSLKNVTVQGTVVVNGGGEGTIVLEDATLETMMVNQPLNRVRIVAKGRTTVKEVILQTGALLEEGVLEGEFSGFKNLTVYTQEDVDLVGDFGEVSLMAPARLMVRLGKVEKLVAAKEAKDSYIEFFEGAATGTLELSTPVEIAGVGEVQETRIQGGGLTKLAGKFGEMKAGGLGIFIELTGGKVEALTVEASDGTVSIQVPQGALISSLILDGKASVTGSGTIEHVKINANGTTIDQSPEKVELASGITALVGGKELPEAKPEPKPSTPSEPQLPRVSINSISNISNLYVGDTQTRNITVNPGDANITVRSSSTGVATVSITGNTVTVTAVKPGSADISVTARKTGYRDRTVTFRVSVVGPTTIKSFNTAAGLSPGKTLVYVEIWAKDPQNYRVTIKGTTFNYLASEKQFYAEVNTEDAQRNQVRVYSN